MTFLRKLFVREYSVDQCLVDIAVTIQSANRYSKTQLGAKFTEIVDRTAKCSCEREFRLDDHRFSAPGWLFRFKCPGCGKETGVQMGS